MLEAKRNRSFKEPSSLPQSRLSVSLRLSRQSQRTVYYLRILVAAIRVLLIVRRVIMSLFDDASRLI